MNNFAIVCLISMIFATAASCARTRPVMATRPVVGRTTEVPTTNSPDIHGPIVLAAHTSVSLDSEAPDPESIPVPAAVAAELTLEELEGLAFANNPTLRQAQAKVSSRVGSRVQAGLYPNPRMGYQHNEAGNNGRAGQQGAYIAQEFVRGGKLALQQHAASHAVQSAAFQQAAQEYRVLTAVRTSFYEVLAAQQTITIARELERISQQGVDTTDALIEGGQASRVDLLQARVELNNARIAVQKANNRHRAAWGRLVAVIGQPSLAPTKLAGSLETDSEQLDSDEVFRQILSSSPEVAAAQQDVFRAQVALQRALAEPIPNVDVQAGVQYDYSSEDTIANLQVELPLPIHNRNQGNIIEARAELAGAYREAERIELDLKRRFAATLERYGNASAEVERFKASILPDARESLELLSDAYKTEGRIDFVRLLIAQRTNFQSQIDYLNALRDWWKAKLEIEGFLLTGGLERADGQES